MQTRNLNQVDSQNQKQTQNLTPDEVYENQCKFCFQTEKQSNQKLISPCGCCGSLKYVHKDCLKKWIKTQSDRTDELSLFKTKQRGQKYLCKLCEKNITLQEEVYYIFQILSIFRWIEFLYYIKKTKYYICISLIGSLALTYYFGEFLFGKTIGFLMKLKDFTVIALIIVSLSILLYDQSLVIVKWNSSSIQLTIPYLINK